MRPDDYCELGAVKTATPCSEPWEDMQGDEVKRFCAKCRLYVWNFAELTTDEARALLIETEGRLCGRIFTRADGTVLTRDCPTGVSRQRRKRAAAVAAAASLLGAAAATATAALLPEDEESCPLAGTGTGGLVPKPVTGVKPIYSGNSPGVVAGGLSWPKPLPPPTAKPKKR